MNGNTNKTLHLTLKRRWFQMILSGEKKEEYREIKPYWINRLVINEYKKESPQLTIQDLTKPYAVGNLFDAVVDRFDTVTFKNGYSASAPEMVVQLVFIEIGEGMEEWGAEPGTKYFVLSLGKILSTKNIK